MHVQYIYSEQCMHNIEVNELNILINKFIYRYTNYRQRYIECNENIEEIFTNMYVPLHIIDIHTYI